MTQIIKSFSEIAPRYRAVFCDLWGCVHNGIAPFPAAVAALQAFRATGGKVVLVSNAPRPKASVIKQLERLGVPDDAWDDIATSGDSAQFAMITGAVGRKIYHIGPMSKDKPFFTDFAEDISGIVEKEEPISIVPLDQAEGIVVTGPNNEDTETPEDYRATFLYAKTKGLKLLSANPDIIVDVGHRRIYCAGALAKLYDEMGGQSLSFGKPHPPVYDLARRRLNALGSPVSDEDILCIGDGIDTDILGANLEALDSLFLTEGLAAGQFGPADNLDQAALEAWLAQVQRNPTYTIGMLG
jgi:HAD superfamily hydrolase (TIGR01459 family)